MQQPAVYSSTAVPVASPHTPQLVSFSSSSSTGSSSSSTTTVENCQIMERNRIEQLRQLYENTIGAPMSLAVLKQLLLSITRGTPWQYYEYALEETALAPRPSWRYAVAIVRRLITEKAPAQDVRSSQQKPPKSSGKLLREQDYTQRDYTSVHERNEAELDALMEEFMLEQERR